MHEGGGVLSAASEQIHHSDTSVNYTVNRGGDEESGRLHGLTVDWLCGLEPATS